MIPQHQSSWIALLPAQHRTRVPRLRMELVSQQSTSKLESTGSTGDIISFDLLGCDMVTKQFKIKTFAEDHLGLLESPRLLHTSFFL